MDPGLLELMAAGRPDDDVAVIVRLVPAKTAPAGLRLVAQFGDVATARARRGSLAAIHDHPSVASLKAPRIYAGEAHIPFFDRPAPVEPGLSEADPAPVQTDLRRPAGLAETGRGTIVAVIDWGLDFAHPDFRGASGSTRLIALWDQRAEGKAPHYGYGEVHHRPAINAALREADPFAALGYRPSASATPAHGTHVMGIAAGNGRAGGPAGIAPEADLVFVHLGPGLGDLGNSIDLLEAIDFVIRSADGKPVAINMSIGRHAGPHDGTLLVERAIDWLIVNRPGTVVVQSTGNYYSRNVHMNGRLREARTARLPFRIPRADAHKVTVEIWYKGADRLTARAFAPDGSVTVADLGSSALLTDASSRELGRLYHRARDPNNGDNLIALVLQPMADAGQWAIELAGTDVVDGRWHAWIERNASCPKCQATFPPGKASRSTTTGSICNAMRTIAVGAYDAHHPEMPLALFSSVGPTRDGRQKPLLVAPGVRVLSVRSRASAHEPPEYVRMSGTSMAAPHVTGTAALMLEAAGHQPIATLRRTLFATLDPPPQDASVPARKRWGYGILNVEAAVLAARRLSAGQEPQPVPMEYVHEQAEPVAQTEQQENLMMEQEDFDGAETADTGSPVPSPTLAGPPVADEERRWTKGRKHSLPTPEERVLSQFSDAQLRDMLDLPPAPPIAVAMRESIDVPPTATEPGTAPPTEPTATGTPPPADPAIAAPPATEPEPVPAPDPVGRQEPGGALPSVPVPPPDPNTLINLAVNPQVPTTQVVGWPGARLAVPLIAGDIILRGRGRGKRRAAMVSRPGTVRRRAARSRRGSARESGFFAETIGSEGFERIAGPDGLLLPDVTIVRSWEAAEFYGETIPPPALPPTIRQGSRGVAVTDAQTRLNAVHANRVGSGQTAIDRCPLVVDGIFGPNTRAATISFQRIAFPATPSEWDGIIGPRTWTALIAASTAVVPVPPVPPVPVVSTATIEFVLDDDGDHVVDGSAPVATALMFGLWDSAYDSAGDVRNGVAEAANFVGRDARRFYVRVNDSGATGGTVVAQWHSVNGNGTDDDAPANRDITLTETGPGSKIFVSKALMLVSDDIDADQQTHSGFSSGPAAGLRSRGQSNHRLRRANLEGSVVASYNPASGSAAVSTTLPVFQRTPTDQRRRLPVNVINYDSHATQAQINAHFARARRRWAQVGLQIDQGATVSRTLPAAARDGTGSYPGSRDSDEEVAALTDLIGVVGDDSITVVFVRMPGDSHNAYATVFQRTRVALGDRFVIFINPDVALGFETLGHEFHHILFNRGDTPVSRQFFSFNTSAPALQNDPRSYRRIHKLHSTDPNNDPGNDNVINWIKRSRTRRFQNAAGDLPAPLEAPDATTGNTLTRSF